MQIINTCLRPVLRLSSHRIISIFFSSLATILWGTKPKIIMDTDPKGEVLFYKYLTVKFPLVTINVKKENVYDYLIVKVSITESFLESSEHNSWFSAELFRINRLVLLPVFVDMHCV
jgi:hypothetical protein